MPFPDELTDGVVVVLPNPGWAAEGTRLCAHLTGLLNEPAVRVDHIGSTSVPGLAAKDCLDIGIAVAHVDDPQITDRLTAAGFRLRPEPWNREETSFGERAAKRVFAPPVGARRVNVHVRAAGGVGVRYALLFRDHLRAVPQVRDAWGAFKQQLVRSMPDIYGYGQAKARATEVLMHGAVAWAAATGWTGLQRLVADSQVRTWSHSSLTDS